MIQFTEYDIMGNVLTMLDARGKRWSYVYDPRGRLTSVTDPLGHSTSRSYDAAGNLAGVTDPNGNVASYTYDLSDNLIQLSHALGNTTFEYNADGKLLRQIDPEGRILEYEYDNDGRQTLIRDGLGNEIRMEYEKSGVSSGSCTSCSGGGAGNQLTRIIYPTFVKEFRYDERGRKIKELDIVDSETLTTSYSYDPAGNLISQTDKAGQSTGYSYDALNRLTSVTDAAGTTSYIYNPLGNLTSLTDAKNQTTSFSYDSNGRLITEIRPMNQTTSYNYDGAGNLIEKVDAKQQTTSYSYDDAGRLAQIQYADSTVTFNYDNAGNLTSYEDGVTSGSYSYNALNQKLSETVTYGNLTKSFSYDYYANSLKKSFTMPDGTAYEYTYGENNELREIRLPGTGAISYPSYTWTRPDAVQYPGGGRREYSYDPLMRLTRITANDPGKNILLDYSYTYDTMDNILSKQTGQGTYNYTYDALYRLTDVQVDIPGVENEGFGYDAVGNRLSEEGVEGEWSYNDNNELLTFATTEYTYDANGHATQLLLDGTVMFTYHYNAQDRLVQVDDVNGSTIAEYSYDPFGRRLWKDVGGNRIYFFYADEGLVAEYDASGFEIRTYGYRPDSIWTTDPLWLKQGGEYYFYQNDHLGTPQTLVQMNGAIAWSASYTAFGKATVDVETVTNNLRFPGQYFDAEAGLHYNWVRYYQSEIGRYLQPDVLREENFAYIYVKNNPINKFDFSGLKEEGCIWFTTGAGTGSPVGCNLLSVILHRVEKLGVEACRLCWRVECPGALTMAPRDLVYKYHGNALLKDEPGLTLEFKIPCTARPRRSQDKPIITGTPFPDEWQTRQPEGSFNVCIAVSSKTIISDIEALHCLSLKYKCCCQR